jgi:hypothetical protein
MQRLVAEFNTRFSDADQRRQLTRLRPEYADSLVKRVQRCDVGAELFGMFA